MRLQRQHLRIRGTVRAESGDPLEGVMVMGIDLAYAETAADGSFILSNPEMALFFWRSGFYPRTHVLTHNSQDVEITMRAVRMKQQRSA